MQDSKTLVAPEIPLDLLIEILARLPAKSVMRFKCVSMFWSSLLRSKYFCNRLVMLTSPRLYMCLFNYDNSKSLLLSSAPTPTTFPSSLELEPDLNIREMGGYRMHIHRGLICFEIQSRPRISNPSTKQLVILPSLKDDIKDGFNNSYFICHEPVNDQYKILCTIYMTSTNMKEMRSERWIFVLEAGGFWKRVAKDFPPHCPVYLKLIMNGVLYYSAWTDLHTCVLVSFDISSEEFNMIHVPRKTGDVLTRYEKGEVPIKYDGKVAVFVFTYLKDTGTVDLWIVEDWSKNEWSTKTLVVKPSQMHLVLGNHFIPRGTTINGQLILVPLWLTSSPLCILYYDLKSNDLQKVEIKGVPDHWFRMPQTVPYFDMRFMDPSEGIEIEYLQI